MGSHSAWSSLARVSVCCEGVVAGTTSIPSCLTVLQGLSSFAGPDTTMLLNLINFWNGVKPEPGSGCRERHPVDHRHSTDSKGRPLPAPPPSTTSTTVSRTAPHSDSPFSQIASSSATQWIPGSLGAESYTTISTALVRLTGYPGAPRSAPTAAASPAAGFGACSTTFAHSGRTAALIRGRERSGATAAAAVTVGGWMMPSTATHGTAVRARSRLGFCNNAAAGDGGHDRCGGGAGSSSSGEQGSGSGGGGGDDGDGGGGGSSDHGGGGGGVLASIQPRVVMVFTCAKCDTRSTKSFSKLSYMKGVVLVRCPGCQKLHLIADHLGWFGEEPFVLHEFLAERGQNVIRVSVDEPSPCPPSAPRVGHHGGQQDAAAASAAATGGVAPLQGRTAAAETQAGADPGLRARAAAAAAAAAASEGGVFELGSARQVEEALREARELQAQRRPGGRA